MKEKQVQIKLKITIKKTKKSLGFIKKGEESLQKTKVLSKYKYLCQCFLILLIISLYQALGMTSQPQFSTTVGYSHVYLSGTFL